MNFGTMEEIKNYCETEGYDIGFSKNVEAFHKKKKVNETTLENSIAILPMEGCDAHVSGAPSELTQRRYIRFAKSGAALIWLEAMAVEETGRATPHQLFLNEQTQQSLAALCAMIKQEGKIQNGFEPVVIAQLTHSGRYSKPNGIPAPVKAAHNPWLDEKFNINKTDEPISDISLQALEEKFVQAAIMTKEAGFDGIDIKMCHGYLLNELLSAFTRTGEYGGSYEGRTRFVKNVLAKVRQATRKSFIIGSRINIFDAMPYPYGFGMDKDGSLKSNLSEPIRLVTELKELTADIIGITMGNPYYNPHYNRPFDKGGYISPEPPLKSVERLLVLAKQLKKQTAGMPIVGAGYTYLREFAINAGAYALENGGADLIGFGRQAFAYPEFVSDILNKGSMDSKKVCIACSKCTQIMRNGGPTGCIVRDNIYRLIYKEYCGE